MKKFLLVCLLSGLTGYAMQSDVPQLTEFNVHGYGQPQNAPHIENGNWTAGADFLYWQATEDNLEFATVQNLTASLSTFASSTVMESAKLNFHWDPGFRVNLGYSGDDRAWDFLAAYTYMHNTAKGSKSVPGIEIVGTVEFAHLLTPEWFPTLLGPSSLAAKGHWSLNYNIGDVILGRNFFISKDLAFHPYFGLRGGSISQNYRASYSSMYTVNIFSGGSVTLTGGATSFKAKNEFNFGGIRGGTDLLWHWSSHWSILGKASGSLVYGKFHVKEKFNGFHDIASRLLSSTFIDNESYWRTRANLESYIGLQWETFFGCSTHIAINLGYEISYWFQQNELNAIIAQSDTVPSSGTIVSLSKFRRTGNLGLQGVTFNFAIDF